MKLEAQTLAKIKSRINEKVMSCHGTWIDWQYLLDAAALLAKCRYTLQYTYPYAYYMEPSPRKELVSWKGLTWLIEFKFKQLILNVNIALRLRCCCTDTANHARLSRSVLARHTTAVRCLLRCTALLYWHGITPKLRLLSYFQTMCVFCNHGTKDANLQPIAYKTRLLPITQFPT